LRIDNSQIQQLFVTSPSTDHFGAFVRRSSLPLKLAPRQSAYSTA
jgi:hypothetical protein